MCKRDELGQLFNIMINLKDGTHDHVNFTNNERRAFLSRNSK